MLQRRARALLRRTVHADLVVRTKSGFETVDVDRGKVTAVSASSITIARPDGVSVSAGITSTTKFRGLTQAQVAAGDPAAVVQTSGNALDVFSKAPGSTSSSSATSPSNSTSSSSPSGPSGS